MNRRLFILGLLMSVATIVCADVYLGVGLSGAYPWHLRKDAQDVATTLPAFNTSLGYRGEAGVSINYQHEHFLLSAGLGAAYQMASVKLAQAAQSNFTMTDGRGVSYEYQIILDPRRDQLKQLDIEIPVLLGAEISSFYFLAGVKFAFNAYAATRVDATYTTQSIFDRYYEPIIDYSEQTYSESEPVKLTLGIRGVIEAGASLTLGAQQFSTKKGKQKLRIAAYLEFAPAGQQLLTHHYTSLVQPDDNKQPQLYHLYTISNNGAPLINTTAMCAGIRLTYLIPLHTSSHKSARGGNRKCHCEK